ncbi:pseudouridine synthase [Microbulbifer sp. OS29]|uniref:Pseudouridine synthase n=1 Tax=Microbulbifer okhotskensis TaxID=2926617 RepID=A0A9X2ERF1_9GAMM|nr:pseudouridine synthase [Microbulbifer okhotskensis]MCO1334326.1 pseudouridine synthase [Microbulbifer okhotskensis]
MTKIILLNKPFGVLSQFTDSQDRATLANYIQHKGFYAAGRLDHDSEGLLLLTDDGALQHQISHPKKKVAKTYWAQVEGQISDEGLSLLRAGVDLKDGRTAPAKARRLSNVELWPRVPPIRKRQSIPTSWLELTINEGRNRQVRRMTAAVGFPTLRLVRMSIGNWKLNSLQPGEYRLEEVFSPQKPRAKPLTGHSRPRRKR